MRVHLYLERSIAEPITKGAVVKFDKLVDVSKKLVIEMELENQPEDQEDLHVSLTELASSIERSEESTIEGVSATLLSPHSNDSFQMMELNDEQDDFDVVDGCYIDILNAGNYLVEWATRSMTGFSKDAPWFELRYFDVDAGGVWKAFGSDPAPGVVKGPSGVGTMPLQVTEEILLEHGGKFRIALFNAASNNITLHRTAAVKASLIIYGIPKFDKIISALLEEFYREKERCCVILTLPRVIELENHEALQYLRICCLSYFRDRFQSEFEDHFYPHEFTEFSCYNWGSLYAPDDPNTPNDLRVKVLKIGTFYLFTLHGQMLNPPSTTSTPPFKFTDSTPTTAYFLRSEPYRAAIDPPHAVSAVNRRYFPVLQRLPIGQSSGKLIYPFVYDTKANSSGSFGVSAVFLDRTGIYFEYAGGDGRPRNIHYGFSIGVIIPDVKDADGNTIPDDFSVFPYV